MSYSTAFAKKDYGIHMLSRISAILHYALADKVAQVHVGELAVHLGVVEADVGVGDVGGEDVVLST